ncbi:MAG: nucleotidyltransferase family protein [Syntrophobacteraceae bacterium]|nr:nucleotidyltransferase family protein [Syntrophobacteraceae bacterium]
MNAAERDITIRMCREHNASMVGIFGSTARGKDSKGSDIDILVRFAKPVSLLSLVRLERDLSQTLARKVDLLTESAISPYLRDRILKELLVIHGKRRFRLSPARP